MSIHSSLLKPRLPPDTCSSQSELLEMLRKEAVTITVQSTEILIYAVKRVNLAENMGLCKCTDEESGQYASILRHFLISLPQVFGQDYDSSLYLDRIVGHVYIYRSSKGAQGMHLSTEKGIA